MGLKVRSTHPVHLALGMNPGALCNPGQHPIFFPCLYPLFSGLPTSIASFTPYLFNSHLIIVCLVVPLWLLLLMEHQGTLYHIPRITTDKEDSLDSSCHSACSAPENFLDTMSSLWLNEVQTSGEIDQRYIPALRLEGAGSPPGNRCQEDLGSYGDGSVGQGRGSRRITTRDGWGRDHILYTVFSVLGIVLAFKCQCLWGQTVYMASLGSQVPPPRYSNIIPKLLKDFLLLICVSLSQRTSVLDS